MICYPLLPRCEYVPSNYAILSPASPVRMCFPFSLYAKNLVLYKTQLKRVLPSFSESGQSKIVIVEGRL